jgi:hypothetical protein
MFLQQPVVEQIGFAPLGISQALPLFAAGHGDVSWVFIELGAAVIGLAVLARLAHRFGFSAIPFYLLGGLAFTPSLAENHAPDGEGCGRRLRSGSGLRGEPGKQRRRSVAAILPAAIPWLVPQATNRQRSG